MGQVVAKSSAFAFESNEMTPEVAWCENPLDISRGFFQMKKGYFQMWGMGRFPVKSLSVQHQTSQLQSI